MPVDPTRLETALRNTRAHLLEQLVDGHRWEGELASSALSTATASFALALYCRAVPSDAELQSLVRDGINWLVQHQNPDGGWGDTALSHSNISTTALCWAALSVGEPHTSAAIKKAEAWLTDRAGSVAPSTLARAIADRYGKDRTFSVPILTMCALAGRLGKDGWQLVPELPFELAACPPAWFRWLQLPVVSYALPALIAIGQVGHHHRRGGNPVARVVRNGARNRTLEVLRGIQPEGGGFLEATPLTSFVTMSLVGCGLHEHPVVQQGVAFLRRSVRPDGSWPIDTNLSTWVTTLSINALASGCGLSTLPSGAADGIKRWLLSQQYRTVHPYTQAAPGGWAWTDLPGGVPDADDTPGALIALRHLGAPDPEVIHAVTAGVRWLLDLQNRDGGIPTFCKGWGALPFDRSGADLTAHALVAWDAWREDLPLELQARVDIASGKALRYLAATQRADGSWLPLWFGNQHAAEEENPTYGTARVLPALLRFGFHPNVPHLAEPATEWLLQAQNLDGGWGGDRGTPSSIEETGLAVQALAQPGIDQLADPHRIQIAVNRGVEWLIDQTLEGIHFPPSPIGFYFAKLWYFEKLYPVTFALGALESAGGGGVQTNAVSSPGANGRPSEEK